ncbi:MAG TPA: response regulator transcription factor, partial [Miltoncostaeaceae bacterium]|nr:response regulator transcription factor [Miltoncostaeaceae bacterium]
FDLRVTAVASGREMQQVLDRSPADVVLLDLRLPREDGLQIARQLRERSKVPIIILTGRHDEADRVMGLELGADDYVTKPFSPRELVSRVKANLRRARLEPDRTAPLRVGGLEIDATARTVRRGDEEIPLTYSEFEILNKLASSPRRVFTREELMNHLWKGNFYGDLRSVDVHVRHLRQKVEEEPSEPVLIRTVRGVGYAFGGEDGRGT